MNEIISLNEHIFKETDIDKRIDAIKNSYDRTFETMSSERGEFIWKEFGDEEPVFVSLAFLPEAKDKSEGTTQGFFERSEGSNLTRILAYLQEKKHPVAGSRIPWKDEEALEKLIDRIGIAPKLQYIGLSAFSFEIPWAEEVAKRIKQERPDISIILGGPHADTCYIRPKRFYDAYNNRQAKNNAQLTSLYDKPDDSEIRRLLKYFNYIAIGSGEIVIDKLLQGKVGHLPVLRGGTPENFQKQETKNKLNKFINPVRLLGGTEVGFYPLPENYTGTATYSGTEGCPNNCSFCTSALTCERQYQDRRESIPELVKAIGSSKENLIWFDNETSRIPWLKELSEELKRQNVRKYWILMSSIESFSVKKNGKIIVNSDAPKVFKMMSENGCLEICYGVETVDPEMASKYDKTRDNDLTNQVLGLTSDAGIIPRAMMIVGGPNETQETLNKLISWAKESPALSFRIAYFTPFQGTPDWHIANQEEQWLSEEFKNNLEHHTTEEPVLKAPIIIEDGRVDNEELEKFRKFKTEALKEIYNSPEYHAKIKKFINKHPDKVVMVRGLIYLFERQGLAEEGSFNYLF